MAVPSSWFKNPRLVKKIKHFHDHLKKNDGKIVLITEELN